MERRVPEPVSAPPLEVDGIPLPSVGWRHAETFYVFTVGMGPTGRYHAGQVNAETGVKQGSSSNYATADEARAKAADWYWRVAFGADSRTFEAIASDPDRLRYWRIRYTSLMYGDGDANLIQLARQLLPAGLRDGSLVRGIHSRDGSFATELLVGPDHNIQFHGKGPNPTDAAIDVLVKLESWVRAQR